MFFQADKGKTIVIINSEEYSKKIHSFLTDNFHSLQKELIDKYQKPIQNTLQQCNLIIDKEKIKYLNQKKPLPPTLKAQLNYTNLTFQSDLQSTTRTPQLTKWPKM